MITINPEFEKLFPKDVPVIFLHAHADDESFLSAGIMAELIRTGRTCLALYAAAALVQDQPKTVIRQKENSKACALIGIKDMDYLEFCEPKYFDPDAIRLIEQDPETVCRSLEGKLKKHLIDRPFILVSYDMNGGYGNQDHIIVHKTGRLFKKNNARDVKNLYEVTLRRDGINAWLNEAKLRLEPDSIPKLSYWREDFGLSDAEITHVFELSNEQIFIKKQALAAHQSQNKPHEFPLSLNDTDFREIFGKEFFKVCD